MREERQRLGLSQERLAQAMGVAKNTAINWEKDASSPTANALISFAEAGADALYILTGRRTPDRSDEGVAQVEDWIASIRRDMLVPEWEALPGEDATDVERRVIARLADQVANILSKRAGGLTPELIEQLESLRTILSDPSKVDAFRAADRAQHRARRKRMRERICAHTDLGDYQPSEPVIALMTTIALDYSVPVHLLAELVYEIVASDEPSSTRGVAAQGA